MRIRTLIAGVAMLLLFGPAVASANGDPLRIEWKGGHRYEICGMPGSACLRRELPKQIHSVKSVISARFIRKAMVSWLVVSEKDVSLCALRNDVIGSICLSLNVNVKNLDLIVLPDFGGNLTDFQFIFHARKTQTKGEVTRVANAFATAYSAARLRMNKLLDMSLSDEAHQSVIMSGDTVGCAIDEDAFCDSTGGDGGGGGGGDAGSGGGGDAGGGGGDTGGGSSGDESGGGTTPTADEGDGGQVVVIIGERPAPPPDPETAPLPANSQWCSLLPCNSTPIPPPPPPPDPEKERCDSVFKQCRDEGIDKYVYDKNSLPGTGTDYNQRMWRYVRECMAELKCYNY